MNNTPSLHLSFADNRTKIRLVSTNKSQHELRRLIPKFHSVIQPSPGVAELELDDFLANIHALHTWSTPESVTWESGLAQLVESSIRDSQKATRLLEDSLETPEIIDLNTLLGKEWTGNLTEFQQRDLERLLNLGHGANFSVPGAGKTRVALGAYAAYKSRGDVRRMLVVGPKSCYDAWQEETLECFATPPRVSIFENSAPLTAEILIVNYERLSSSLDTLIAWLIAEPTMLILDEAHRMKLGAKGTYGSACLALGPRAKRRLILTGTPAPNGVRDLENLFGFVWPGHGRRSVTRAVANGDLRSASRVLRPLFARTTKHELGLPSQVPTVRRLSLPPLHREIYDALIGHMSPRASSSENDFQALGKVLMYLLMAATSPGLLAVGSTRYEPLNYRVPPLQVPESAELYDLMRDLPKYEESPKYQAAIEIVSRNASLGRKTIIWSTFVRSLTTLNALLGELRPALVHGGTLDREDQIRRFKEDADCMVLLSNPATLGEGISLHHHCHDAVYVDRDFAAGRFLQSLDRIHRLGLPDGVSTRVTILTADDTIDDVVEQRLKVKLDFMGKILDDPDVERLGDLDEEPSAAGALDGADAVALLEHIRGSSS